MKDERIQKAKFFYKMSIHSYDSILTFNSAIDSKIYNVLGLTVGLTPILLGLLYFLMRESGALMFSLNIAISLSFGTLMFMLAIITGLQAYYPTDFEFLSLHEFVNRHHDEELPPMVETAAATVGTTTEANRDVVNRKASAYRWMIQFIVLGGIGFSVGFMFLLASFISAL